MDQWINLKFLVKLGKCPTECLELLKEVFGEHLRSQTQVYEWNKRLKSICEEVEDDHKSGQPSTTKISDNINRRDHSIMSSSLRVTQLANTSTSKSSITCMTGFGRPDGLCGGTSHGCSTTISRPLTPRSVWDSYWSKNRSQLLTTLHISQISHRVTSGFSLSWRLCSNEHILPLLKSSRLLWQWS